MGYIFKAEEGFMSLEKSEKMAPAMAQVSENSYVFLATTQELKERGGQLTKWVSDHDILLYEFEGGIKALSNICRHFGGPVGYHQCTKGVFTCLWHNWQFSAKDGACLTQAALPLRQYAVQVTDGKIYVKLTE